MSPFAGRRIVLGVTGGIAAYKAVEICRRLVEAGAHVTPVLTEAARRFVGEVTFSALAGERARLSLFEDEDPIPHITLGRRAELILVCPATARAIGAYAAGLCDDLLGATLLATRAPVVVCPAMHTEMWEHPATGDNLRRLTERGVTVVAPEEGPLAGGDVGAGRLAAPESILATAAEALAASGAAAGSMAGLRVLVTAGGTREPIDPVRFVGNRSSGKQGYALAVEAAARGAKVTLVATVQRPLPESVGPESVDLVLVETAEEMRTALADRLPADVVLMAAAVADYRPAAAVPEKMKKTGEPLTVTLEPNPDILAELGRSGSVGTLVGFAAETSDVLANAEAKLRTKGADLIVVNDVSAPRSGFDHDTNAVTILAAAGDRTTIPLAAKRDVARAILDRVTALRASR
ncbi:MAG: bifunctional phosphopantothenoylcysteine decarboxylase/phosphopantothenate--cysteine ligase CoaBC [bacterium]|nr:bifunctional phosphopantothenoylcysteine decarboxylase/phosphopantothenate--cysteine ligase CoaBC [bacterium]MDE0669410.1 bifunctional phosphopantothenoylcysteine decarboxylase/phosphopantothenate--cysteine ligase CoaBC [bacterium]MXZ31301.1 bifunctional phosphopantothenoylcysteine decarboxylase/phosphopantothenate--cysteine ligase CoaBC [Acidimicrobiia bacterium]MYB24665.1 bifunctional phosphopantothenoylcysteine decarboxylase/phosphopantothenate--cysteine ligase CoaBC [Acidimicrobiia bacter